MVKEISKAKKSNTKSKKDETLKNKKKNVATKKSISKKETVKKEGFLKRIKNWIKSAIKEVSKVKWPSRKEMLKYSVATIVFVVFFALFFGAIELLMAFLKSLV